MGQYCRPESRSKVAAKVSRVLSLVVRVQTESGNSFEEDAMLLKEAARLCLSAAHDLHPQGDEG